MDLFKFIAGATNKERRRFDSKQHWRLQTGLLARPSRLPYAQHEFMQLLYLERRRSERSSQPLCLILLDGVNIVDRAIRENAFQHVFQLLRSSVRETDVIGWYGQSTTLAIMFSDLKSIDPVIVHNLQTKIKNTIASGLAPELVNCIGISAHLFPKADVSNGGRGDLAFYPDLAYQSRTDKTAHVFKRLIDIVGSLVLLSLLSPLFALIALTIKLGSRGPVLFRQVRVGWQGRPFSFWKFRSMYVGSDPAIHKEYVTRFISHGQPASGANNVYKLTDDPRVTRVGRILRKTSLAELPQLWNVLRGDMSLVGPRPPLPYELECYSAWHRRRILEVKPGITGLWQVSGRSRTTFTEMVRLDLRYVQQWSIWLDFKILLQTPKAVLLGEGAY